MPALAVGFAAWAACAAFYLFDIFIRLSINVITEQLQADFNLDATTVSACFGSSFYISYAIIQIPIGSLTDRFGPRRTLSACCFLLCLGNILFSVSHSLWLGTFARLLGGVGAGAAWVGTMQVINMQFGVHSVMAGNLVSITNALGAVGGLISQAPFHFICEYVGWRKAYLILAVVPFCLSIAIYVLLNDRKRSQMSDQTGVCSDLSPSLATSTPMLPPAAPPTWYSQLFRPQLVLLAFYAAGMDIPFETLAGLWGEPYFHQSQGLSSTTASGLSTMFVAVFSVCVMMGGPLCARFRTMRIRCFILASLGVFGLVGMFVLIVFPQHLPLAALVGALLGVGFSGAGISIVWILIVAQPSAHHGLCNGAANATTIGLVAVTQAIVGAILDANWHGDRLSNGARVYSPHAFRYAFVALVASFTIAILCALSLVFLNEKALTRRIKI
eukprot:c4473_g1_i2.p1 GENE.c4473_g1_i2~~c4473_g1_i2.p1  ORF type:complete len:453 (+),score=64.62 c4473_g1_i2:32-1360(+)